MINPDTFALIDPDTDLAPNETVCPVHNLTYHAPLGACPECENPL
ncbi:hypothetical protein [Kribbella sp. CA-293567]|nr:hypothetical protein [Kribbella sp. CA-293567]WBQ03804.1 hypothetical protein OX958_28020 [Kribbella sp. CA-293567]